MVSHMNKILCTGCGVCESICPAQCIKMKRDNAGFLYPDIDETICIRCNKCDQMCHAQNIKSEEKDKPFVFIAYNKDEKERIRSSSGGVFVTTAIAVINMGGVVYGAAFDNKLAVNHIRIEDKNDIYQLQGSKYVQSTIRPDIYTSTKIDLLNGKYVLFSGTPCQIGALRKYLGKDYESLFTVSFICHGVPAPSLWLQYCEWQKKKNKSDIVKVSHRNKDYGWINFSMKLFFLNGKKYIKRMTDDPYLQLFLKNTCLRTSCHSCQYKGHERLACIDIMLADKWGTVSGSLPNMKDDKGISLVFVQSLRGMDLWKMIDKQLFFDKTNFEEAVASNSSYYLSSKASVNRENVINGINKLDIPVLYSKYAKTSFYHRSIDKLKKKSYFVAKYCGIVWIVQQIRIVKRKSELR